MGTLNTARTSYQSTAENNTVRDISSLIYRYAPGGLFQLKGGSLPNSDGTYTEVPGMLKTKMTEATKIEWQEKELYQAPVLEVNGIQTNVDTGIDVLLPGGAALGTAVPANALYKNTTTGEVIIVSSATTAILTVVRGVGNSGTGLAMLDNEILIPIGFSYGENQTPGEVRSSDSSVLVNHTQIIRNAFELSGTENEIDKYNTQDAYNELRTEALFNHAADIESILLEGKPEDGNSISVGGKKRRACGGLSNFLTFNNYTASTGGYDKTGAVGSRYDSVGGHAVPMTYTEFIEEFAPNIGRYNNPSGADSREWTILGGNIIGILFADFQNNNFTVETEMLNDTIGAKVTRMITPFGDFIWRRSGTIEERTPGKAYVIKPEFLTYRPLKNRDTKLIPNIETNGQDGRKDEYLTEFSFEVNGRQAMGVIDGL